MQESDIFTEFEDEPRKVGRPAIDIDMEQLKTLARLQCTDAEIASVLGVSLRTFAYRKKANPEIADIIAEGKAYGSASLKREQFRQALAGNAVLQIWLGKVYGGQREPVQRLEVKQVKPISEWTDDELTAALELEAGRAAQSGNSGAGSTAKTTGQSGASAPEFPSVH